MKFRCFLKKRKKKYAHSVENIIDEYTRPRKRLGRIDTISEMLIYNLRRIYKKDNNSRFYSAINPVCYVLRMNYNCSNQ